MIAVALVSCLSLMIYFLAVWRGGAPERIAGGLMLAVFVADEIRAVVVGRMTFGQFETFLFVTDVSQLVVFTWLAVRANRLWPMVAAALKLVTVVGHLAAFLLLPSGMKLAYWVMVESPTLPTILTLGFGLVAHWRRRHRIGPYPDWRADAPLR